MLYHYEGYSCKYTDDGNHAYDDYESYSNHAESNHGDPDPTPSELVNTSYDDTTPLKYEEFQDVEINRDVYDLRELADAISSEEYGHGDKGFKHREEEYEHRELKEPQSGPREADTNPTSSNMSSSTVMMRCTGRPTMRTHTDTYTPHHPFPISTSQPHTKPEVVTLSHGF